MGSVVPIDPVLRARVAAESAKRRTFAIISHPDAGKTTLTEKLLLYAGMIQTAGMVRGRKSAKATSSDWMTMERERGISITASAMQFLYKDTVINVLDTPGHQDFSEDTYRTLTAADSAVMVIDAAKGVEPQTRKLFAVCRMRGIPILTFVNKLDLPSRDPFELLSEVEEVLSIKASPLFWPIGNGKEFKGVASVATGEIFLFERSGQGGSEKAAMKHLSQAEALRTAVLSADEGKKLAEDLELIREAGNPYSFESFMSGEISPTFFGSALTNFGIEQFFDWFAAHGPCPSARGATAEDGSELHIEPAEHPFSAYVFKVQANMDPRHRDSMAFLRICSGEFARDLVVKHARLEKEIRLSRSHSMFGGERTTVDAAYPGDIVGVVNPGAFAIGDTVSVEGGFQFKPMPKFPPEVVAQLRPLDVMRRKSFDKGIMQLSDEGAVLVLKRRKSITSEPLVAAVGRLQFEVLQFRLKEEYGVETKLENLPFKFGAWLQGNPDTFEHTSTSMLAEDPQGRVILLYTNAWEKNYMLEKNSGHQLLEFLA